MIKIEMDDSLLGDIICHYGVEHQLVKAIEETNELGVELAKELGGNGNPNNIREELADSLIVLFQLCLIYRIPLEEISMKLSRQRRRMADDE